MTVYLAIETFIIFILGLAVGSFLNVVIDRLPKNLSIIRGRSYCDHCKKTLLSFDLIPIVSFIFLGGRCRFCKSKISFFYPLTELLSGLNFILVYFFFKPQLLSPISLITFLSILIISSSLLVIFFTDLKYLLIPDKLLFLIFFAILVKILADPNLNPFIQIITAFSAFSLFYLIVLLTKGKGLGGGDVKLAFLIGLLHPPAAAVAAFYIAFLTGAITGVILILTGKKKFGQKIAFGPFLVFGCYLTIFLQDKLTKLIQLFFGF